MNTDQKMLLIQSLDPKVEVKLTDTGMHYVNSSIKVSDGEETGIVVRRSERSDHMAIGAFLEEITNIPHHQFLVTSYKDRRREWRWNGAAFAECTSDEAMK